MKKVKWPRPVAEFDVPLYGGRVYIYCDHAQHAQAYVAIGVTGVPDAGSLGCAQMFENTTHGGVVYIIGVFEPRWDVLVHELTHVALKIADRAGFDPQCGNGEPFCYLLDNLFRLSSLPYAKHIEAMT